MPAVFFLPSWGWLGRAVTGRQDPVQGRSEDTRKSERLRAATTVNDVQWFCDDLTNCCVVTAV
jgi:hypothetical protein